ncbi:thiamine-monophosphate kinase [Caenibius tardaugens NBRC 16725]|uniref:Thiamine-monophosphate kinase n=1 Tax=Caenibius tardaugens NBRC 16725 TaxID=1219035 RepID=U2ZS27_9SPHN|nr:thiamine-phosphate kinase [Caenibius tardaugens]AZI34668.1 thiamine-phosphate kinase [Caenibius tardaugens NBRC 16725]GAD48179.1 thiamine-monophosphate kinase [Caenibius tardaugens NBRC 16725]
MNEANFIAALRGLATHPAARGLNDDCAVLELGSETLILTHDAMAEGVHFLPGQDPADVAWKLVAANMSDLASKGAEPLGILLGYMFGRDDRRFLAGLEEALAAFKVPLLGGDTISGAASGRGSDGCGQVLGLTAIGRASYTPVPARSGARAGDGLYLTGPVGGAMMGFETLLAGADGDSTAYRRPHAHLQEGQMLAPHVSAMMDVSDGLLLDTWRMAQASHVTIAIDSHAVPIAAPEDRREDALRWGDDYQLLFTASAETDLPVNVYRVGEVLARDAAPLVLDGAPIAQPDGLGYQHKSQ